MSKRLKRLVNNSEFQELYANGKKVYSNSFILFFLPADTLSFGVVASKKTFGIAVKRNRAKRRLRELFRLIAKAGILKTGKFVLIGRKAVLTEEFSRLQSELEKCLKKA